MKWANACTKYATAQLPATFNNYFKLIKDVHSYDTRQVKTRQFALPKARSNSSAKMIKYSAIEIWSKIPPEIKNKTCLALFRQCTRIIYYSATRTIFYVFIYYCTQSKWIDLITYRYYSGNVKSLSISVMSYIVRLLLRSQKLFSSNQCMKLWDAYKTNAFPLSRICLPVLFRKAWLRDWFSTCLNLVTLLRCCSGL